MRSSLRSSSQTIPVFDLRPALQRAHAAVQTNLQDFYQHGQYILGPQTRAFEAEFAATLGGTHAVGVGSGTSALELCLRDAGITERHAEVIVPSMTSMFTAHAVCAAGASVRIADVEDDTLLLSREALERAASPETRAVIAVHLYGQPCDLQGIAALCRERGWVLIQDACQAHGARVQGRPLTDFSPYTAYSFYPTKNLGALGDGGAIVTADPAVATRLRRLRDGGRDGDQYCRVPAVNSRLDELHCCYLRAFLPYLEDDNRRRREIANRYAAGLRGAKDVRLVEWNADSVHHLVVLRSPHRDALRAYLAEEGIHTGIHYPVPLHEQPGLLPAALWSEEPVVAARAAREILSLPIGLHVTDDMVDDVVDAIRRFPEDGASLLQGGHS